MSGRQYLLAVWLAVASAVMPVMVSAQDLPPAMENWPGCSSYDTMDPSLRLCVSGKVDRATTSYMTARLSTGLNDYPHFCAIEAAIIQSQLECPASEHFSVFSRLEELMRRLAENWEERGELERADRWYAQAFARQRAMPSQLGKTDILRGWTKLKIRRGEREKAREFAKLMTERVRADYDPNFSHHELANALRFEAIVLTRLGYRQEAAAAKQEARQLEKLPNPCLNRDPCGRVRPLGP